MRCRSAVLLFVLLMSACGKSPTAPSASFAGRWDGTFESGGDGPGTITLHLDQMNLQIAGSAELSQNEFVDVPAMVTGTLAAGSSPTTVKLAVTYAYGPFQCQGSFTGTLNITTRELDGPFSGENCVRSFVGRLHAVKSN